MVSDSPNKQAEPEELAEKDEKGLIELLHGNCGKFFLDQFGTTYVEVGREVLPIFSRRFKAFAARLYYEEKQKAAGTEIINAALNVIDAYAHEGGERRELCNRVAWHENRILYNMADKEGRIISIDRFGWHFIDNNPPLVFRRWSHQKQQLEPTMVGDIINLLKPYLPVNDNDWSLVKVALVSYFVPHIPKPVLCLYGAQGSGKSILSKIFKSLIDPSVIETASFPKDKNELLQMLSHHDFIAFDNVSHLQDWQSDILCRAVTGEGNSKRQLYTDSDDFIFSFRCGLILNGINLVAQKPDLLDRSILIEMERIPKTNRKTEEELLKQFEEDKPRILSGIFNIISKALEIMPAIKLFEKPRMADFAVWGEAISQAMGYPSGEFTERYLENISRQNAEVIGASVVGEVLLKFIDEKEIWEGTPTELLQQLEEKTEEMKIKTYRGGWPKAPHVLSRRLNELKTNLQEMGVSINFERSSAGRKIRITKEQRKMPTQASLASELPKTDENQQNLHVATRDAFNAVLHDSVTEKTSQEASNTGNLLQHDDDDTNDAIFCYYHKDRTSTGSVPDAYVNDTTVWLCEECLADFNKENLQK